MRYFWPDWPRLSKRILNERRKLLILDFDGTLALIRRQPKEARIDEKAKRMLQFLKQMRDVHIVIISGRSLRDLKLKVGIRGIHYVGNHGLELEGCRFGLDGDGKKRPKASTSIQRLRQELETTFRFFSGVIFEDKKVSLSVHYRNIPGALSREFRKRILFFKKKYKKSDLVWKHGKKVWEVFPGNSWDKGDAALFFSKKFPKALPIVIGDDTGDEAMFKSLKDQAITIRVRRRKSSQAGYYMKSIKEVKLLLSKLCR